jgi:hypothetical protein
MLSGLSLRPNIDTVVTANRCVYRGGVEFRYQHLASSAFACGGSRQQSPFHIGFCWFTRVAVGVDCGDELRRELSQLFGDQQRIAASAHVKLPVAVQVEAGLEA